MPSDLTEEHVVAKYALHTCITKAIDVIAIVYFMQSKQILPRHKHLIFQVPSQIEGGVGICLSQDKCYLMSLISIFNASPNFASVFMSP